MNKDTAQSIINKTKSDYNVIAEHFSQTRYVMWKEFDDFARHIKDSDKVLDLGCGNGRFLHYIAKKKIEYVGLDISEQLIKLASWRVRELAGCAAEYEFVVGDLASLPFNDSSFDVVISIATLHHIPSKKLRQKSFQKIAGVLKPGGVFIMTYWNMWEKSRVALVIKNIIKKIFGRSKLDFFDSMRPWKDPQGKTQVERYNHAFTLTEVCKLARESGLIVMEKKYVKKGKKSNFWDGFNGVLIAKKPN